MIDPEEVRAVLLDLDGTLLDTAPDIAAATADMLSELGLEPVTPAAIRDFIGKGIPHLVRRTLESSLGHSVDERRIGSGMESFFFHYEKRNGRLATLYPGVLEGLTTLHAEGFLLGCVTNKTAQFAIPLLESMGISAFFSAVICGDTTPRKKPAPDPILAACAKLGVQVRETIMVGDSANDSISARAAGVGVYLVPYGYTEGADVQSIDCDGIVPSLLHLAGLLSSQS